MFRAVAGLAALLFASMAWADEPARSTPALADDARVEKLLGEIMSSLKAPSFDRTKQEDAVYVRDYERRLRAALERRVDLIGEFYRLAPSHPMTRELMWKRWAALVHRQLQGRRSELIAEVEKLATEPGNPLYLDATYFKASLRLSDAREAGPDAVMAPIEAFIALAPKDDRGAQLLSKVALLPNTPPDRRSSLIDRILKDYPDSRTVENLKATKRRTESIGKPFELSFRDAITGDKVSVRDSAKGKVVVIEFWAKWCKPCLAELPELKQLYAEFKNQGVEFIGVSLDAPDGQGLEEFKTFVKDSEIEWPQYCGKQASEFARAWGVTRIPSVFVVDTKGNLHSIDARGRLETLIPDLLK